MPPKPLIDAQDGTRALMSESLIDHNLRQLIGPGKPIKVKKHRGRPFLTHEQIEDRITERLIYGPRRKRDILRSLRLKASALPLRLLMNRGIVKQTGRGTKASPHMLQLGQPPLI